MKKKSYSREFYKARQRITQLSAEKILDLIWDDILPGSVLDVGCATGIWLAESLRKGASIVVGIDGPWVPRNELRIEESNFVECDLNCAFPKVTDKYDLALCIEVAEHLPSERGVMLIDFLSDKADFILFSAAVPGQGGEGHVNERNQSYWFSQFSARGFKCVDIVRPNIWEDSSVNVIYKQNMLLYVKNDVLEGKPMSFFDVCRRGNRADYCLDRIHPDLFQLKAERECSKFAKSLDRLIRKIIR